MAAHQGRHYLFFCTSGFASFFVQADFFVPADLQSEVIAVYGIIDLFRKKPHPCTSLPLKWLNWCFSVSYPGQHA